MAITPGARRFDAWVSEIGGNVAAELLGLSEGTVSRLRSGQRGPSLAVAARIERATRAWSNGPIMAASWVPVSPKRARDANPDEAAAA